MLSPITNSKEILINKINVTEFSVFTDFDAVAIRVVSPLSRGSKIESSRSASIHLILTTS